MDERREFYCDNNLYLIHQLVFVLSIFTCVFDNVDATLRHPRASDEVSGTRRPPHRPGVG